MFRRVKYFILFHILIFPYCTYTLDWKFEYDGHEYFFPTSLQKNYTWYDARAACMGDGGDLITIETPAEDDWIKDQATSYFGRLWIGLNRIQDYEVWEWADGMSSTLNNWYQDEPVDNELCAVRVSRFSQYWNSENCGEHLGFICKRLKGSVSPKTTTPAPPVGGFCPSGWTNLETNRCYKAFGPLDEDITWSQALDLCKTLPYLGGNLASGNEVDEVRLLSIIGAQYERSRSLWIGLYRQYYNNQRWKWSDNTVVMHENFHEGYMITDDGCGFTSSILVPAGSWDTDGDCKGKKNGYICQILKDPNNVIPTPAPTQPHPCLPEYVPYLDNCYKIVPERKTQEESRLSCKHERAVLVDIHGSAEDSVIQYLISKHGLSEAWTGLEYDKESDKYEWCNNWYMSFTNWGPDQPDKTQGFDCVKMIDGQGWYMTNCSSQLPYVCKTTTLPPVTPPPELPGRCPNNEWIGIGGLCYYPCSRTCNDYWIDQQGRCQEMFHEARMGSIHNEATNHQLYTALLAQYDRGSAWLGLYQSPKDLKWRWLDGTSLDYSKWAVGEPPSDPESGKFCVFMSLGPEAPGEWLTAPCDTVFKGLLCQVEKIAVPSTPPPSNGTCPSPEWLAYGSYCYLFLPDEFKTWPKADIHCKSLHPGSSLNIIRSLPENDMIHLKMMSLTQLPVTRNYWVGFSREGYGHQYEWVDGTQVNEGFSLWAPNQPEANDKKLCGEMDMQTAMWNNQECEIYAGFVCQMPVIPVDGGTTPSPQSQDDVTWKIVAIVLAASLVLLVVTFGTFIFFRKRKVASPVRNDIEFDEGLSGPTAEMSYDTPM